VIALLGNLARDLFPGREPTVGGGPFHAARALRLIDTPAQLYVRCALEDRDTLVLGVARLGTPVQYVPGESTATFRSALVERLATSSSEAAAEGRPDRRPFTNQ